MEKTPEKPLPEAEHSPQPAEAVDTGLASLAESQMEKAPVDTAAESGTTTTEAPEPPQPEQPQQRQKKVATVRNPTIEAVINGLFRLKDEKQAMERLASLKEYFILSKQQPEDTDRATFLWIKGYAVTPEEEEKGYLGNFCQFYIAPLEDGHWTILAQKVESDLHYHPQKKRKKQKHPNWGHPVLRSVLKGRVYHTVEAAREELELLHTEYPDVTIPVPNKLFVIIYSKQTKPPVKKYILEIKVAEGGGYIIEHQENTYEGKKELPHLKNAEEEAKEPQGYFSSMVALKKKPKK